MRTLPAFVLFFQICAAHATDQEPESTVDFWVKTAEQQTALKAGQVIILESIDNSEGGTPDHATTAAVLINAPLSAVWDVVSDQNEAPNYIKTLLSSKVVKEESDYSLIQQRVKVGFHKIDYMVKHIPAPPSIIRFERVSGDLKSMDGFWRFIPISGEAGEGTLLIYKLSLQPDFPVPAFLIRKSLTDNLPDTLISVRDQVIRSLDGP